MSQVVANAIVAGIMIWMFFISNGAAVSILSFGVAGVAVTFLVGRPSVKNFAFAAVFGLLIAALYFGSNHHYIPCAVSVVMLPMAFLGLGSMVALTAGAWTDTDALRLQLCGSFIPLFALVSASAAFMFTRQTGLYDNNLLRFDEILTGTHPSFLIGRLLEAWPALQNACYLVYDALPIPLVLLLAIAVKYPDKLGLKHSFAVIIVAALAGYAMYQICPAAGPRYVFKFPHGEPAHAASALVFMPDAPINATPSLHFTWVLLVLLDLRRVHRWLAVGAAGFAVMTAIATLGVGEHYLVDLLMAIPFTLALYAGLKRRYIEAAFGAAVTIAWQVLARFLPADGHGLGVGLLITVAASVFVLARISRKLNVQSGKGFSGRTNWRPERIQDCN